MVSEFAVGSDVSIEGHALDSEFVAKGGNRGVALDHCGLSETDLGFGEGEFPAALAAPRPCGGEACHGPFTDEIALEFRESSEDAKDHAARGSGRIDLRPFSGEHSPQTRA